MCRKDENLDASLRESRYDRLKNLSFGRQTVGMTARQPGCCVLIIMAAFTLPIYDHV